MRPILSQKKKKMKTLRRIVQMDKIKNEDIREMWEIQRIRSWIQRTVIQWTFYLWRRIGQLKMGMKIILMEKEVAVDQEKDRKSKQNK